MHSHNRQKNLCLTLQNYNGYVFQIFTKQLGKVDGSVKLLRDQTVPPHISNKSRFWNHRWSWFFEQHSCRVSVLWTEPHILPLPPIISSQGLKHYMGSKSIIWLQVPLRCLHSNFELVSCTILKVLQYFYKMFSFIATRLAVLTSLMEHLFSLNKHGNI